MGACLYVPHFLQPTHVGNDTMSLFLRLRRSLVIIGEALLSLGPDSFRGFPWKWLLCVCAVYPAQSPLSQAVLGCLGRKAPRMPSSAWQLPAWDPALTTLFFSTCTSLFGQGSSLTSLLCRASVLGMALQLLVADLCCQLQILVCVPSEMIGKHAKQVLLIDVSCPCSLLVILRVWLVVIH